jgi:hypothetical protein
LSPSWTPNVQSNRAPSTLPGCSFATVLAPYSQPYQASELRIVTFAAGVPITITRGSSPRGLVNFSKTATPGANVVAVESSPVQLVSLEGVHKW